MLTYNKMAATPDVNGLAAILFSISKVLHITNMYLGFVMI